MKNSGKTLVREMRKILAGFNNVDSYIDDLIIHTNDWQAHLQMLEELLRRFWKAGLTAKPSKRVFGVESVEFLEVRSFLGLANYSPATSPYLMRLQHH